MEVENERVHFFHNVIQARFLSRPNRFLVECSRRGRTLSAFLPNPGRLQELLLPGALVYLVRGEESPGRKTCYTVAAVNREGHPIMLHTSRNNEVARYLLQQRRIPGLEEARVVKSEVRVGRSRFDFLLREGNQDILLEVKSCTQVGRKVAMFPDAVTERGARHVRELAALSQGRGKSVILFLVHWTSPTIFMPDYHTDLNFSQTLLRLRDRLRVIPVSVRWNGDLSFSPEVRVLKIPWDYIEGEATDRGSYLLILNLLEDRHLEIGSLGKVLFHKGFYIYVGSAMSSLSKRMERHRRLRKRHRWHIDELRAVSEFHSLLPIRSSDRLECEIANALSRIAEWTTPGFGSSDCSCKTHLFGMTTNPFHLEKFHHLLQYFRMDRRCEE